MLNVVSIESELIGIFMTQSKGQVFRLN
jgi:hypothetical protein